MININCFISFNFNCNSINKLQKFLCSFLEYLQRVTNNNPMIYTMQIDPSFYIILIILLCKISFTGTITGKNFSSLKISHWNVQRARGGRLKKKNPERRKVNRGYIGVP